MKRKDIIIFLILFINSYEKDWTPLRLWDVTYKNITNSNNSLNYYFMDPDNFLSKEEFNSTKNEILSFGKKNKIIPYVFLIKNIKFTSNIIKERFADIFVEKLNQNIIRIFLENFIPNDKLVLILISVDDKIVSFKLGLDLKSRITNYTLSKIKKKSKSYFENKNLKKTISSIISDFGPFYDDSYDYFDKQREIDNINPFDFDDEDYDDDEPVDPYDQKIIGPHTPYKPKDNKNNEKKNEKNEKKEKNEKNDDKIVNNNKEIDNVIRGEKQNNQSNFYHNLAIILIIVIICFGILFYFLRKKIKELKLKNISYQKLMGKELEQALK